MEGKRRVTASGYRVSLECDENVVKLIMMMVAQFCICPTSCRTVCSQRVGCVIHEYLKQALSKSTSQQADLAQSSQSTLSSDPPGAPSPLHSVPVSAGAGQGGRDTGTTGSASPVCEKLSPTPKRIALSSQPSVLS